MSLSGDGGSGVTVGRGGGWVSVLVGKCHPRVIEVITSSVLSSN